MIHNYVGLLTSVSDLRATSGGTSVTISRSPPFSLMLRLCIKSFLTYSIREIISLTDF